MLTKNSYKIGVCIIVGVLVLCLDGGAAEKEIPITKFSQNVGAPTITFLYWWVNSPSPRISMWTKLFIFYWMSLQLFVRLSKGVRRIWWHSQRKISTNYHRRCQLWSAWHQFLHVQSHFGRENAGNSGHCLVVRHLGHIGTSGAAMVHVVRRKQNLCLHDDFLPWQYARIAGEWQPSVFTVKPVI